MAFLIKIPTSVADPYPQDAYVFGSGSISKQAKIARKALIPTGFVTSLWLVIFEK